MNKSATAPAPIQPECCDGHDAELRSSVSAPTCPLGHAWCNDHRSVVCGWTSLPADLAGVLVGLHLEALDADRYRRAAATA